VWRRRERGAVLIVSLVLLLIITAIAASTLTSSTFQTVVSNNAQKRDTVFHVAESAAERILPLADNVTAAARKTPKTAQKVTLTTSSQPGVAIPEARVTYPGDEGGQRAASLSGLSMGSGVNYYIRSYEIQGDAKTSDDKVKSRVVMGVSKVERELSLESNN
jgi:type IV pilus assembly protein PilX